MIKYGPNWSVSFFLLYSTGKDPLNFYTGRRIDQAGNIGMLQPVLCKTSVFVETFQFIAEPALRGVCELGLVSSIGVSSWRSERVADSSMTAAGAILYSIP